MAADDAGQSGAPPIPFRYGRLLSVSLTQIEYFVAVAEEGQLTRAAARLHVSQPPLTRQIKSLEDELGMPLFRRTRLGMDLLPAGDTFLAHARRVLMELAEAKRAIRASFERSLELDPGKSPSDGLGGSHQ